MYKVLFAVFVVTVFSSAQADVLCQDSNGAVFVRGQCEKDETQLDPVALRLQGQPGPQGLAGPQGIQGLEGPAGPQGPAGSSGLADLFNLGAVLTAIVAVIYAGRANEVARQAAGMASLREFILSEYADREFKATNPPTIDGEEILKLRSAKSRALEKLKSNPKEWEESSDVSKKDEKGNWQNPTAFETADSLEHLGVATFTGAVPLRLVVALVGDAIIDDWLICNHWVKSYRAKQSVTHIGTKSTEVAYHRRHAEWLALVALVWMARNWKYQNGETLLKSYGDMRRVEELLIKLSQADGGLISKDVRKEVRSLTGKRV